MNRLIVMVGLPGSGKSTEAKKLKKLHELSFDKVKIFSSDVYRERLLGNEEDQSNNQLIFKALYEDLTSFLQQENVLAILDATNTTLKSRQRIFESLPKNKKVEVVAQVVNLSYEDCILRDSRRKRSVGKEVIDKFYHGYQHPQKFEGFDYIFFSYPCDVVSIEKYKDLYLGDLFFNVYMRPFNQHNPHHTMTLGNHCAKVGESYSVTDPRHVAGYFHDVGKLFTQKFDEKNIAHYYDHQNIGTYWLITHWNYWVKNQHILDNIQEILFYINYHMHMIIKEDSRNKYKQLFGEDLFNKLKDFEVKDEEAK